MRKSRDIMFVKIQFVYQLVEKSSRIGRTRANS